MRWTVAFLVLSSSPAMAAPPPLCAMMAGPAPIAASDRPAASQAVEAASPSAPSIRAANPQTTLLPAALSAIPFAQHVASAGATLTDLGLSHGLHAIAARNGDQFVLFSITPDGWAAVSGAPIALSLAQLLSIAAGNITELGDVRGLRGYFRAERCPISGFLCIAGRRAIGSQGLCGTLRASDLTRQQVARVPGAIPTVDIGGGRASQAGGAAALPLMQKATFGTIGPDSAPHLYMMIDPQCIYSMRAFQMLRPYAEAGRLQISVIPLSVLDPEDRGQSTRSALALLSDPSEQLINAWQSSRESNVPDDQAQGLLQTNMAIAEAIGLKGTPTFVWRKPDGTEGRLDGLPEDVSAFVALIGS